MNIICPEERVAAWERYQKKFGKKYPAYYKHIVFGNNWEKEVADIDRRIRENDPAPYKELPKDTDL
jgi:hypothetical protein